MKSYFKLCCKFLNWISCRFNAKMLIKMTSTFTCGLLFSVIVVESSIDFGGLYFVQGMWVVFIMGQITQ